MVRHTGEDFIYVRGIAVATVLAFHTTGIDCFELDAPETDGFSAHGDTPLSEQILNISMTEVEAIVKPESLPHEVLWVQRRK